MSQTIAVAATDTRTGGRISRREKGKAQAIQRLLSDLVELPPYTQAPDLYRDWGEEGEFKVEVGQGECAQ